MTGTWLLLIYTVPSAPSRKRASIWRELKKVGALYLRDGVCALPHRDTTTAALRAIAGRVDAFGGEATLVEGARLDPARAEALVARSRAERAGEYAEVGREAERFLAHVRRERAHREFTIAELGQLEADLGKLRRWLGQVRARDHFGADDLGRAEELLRRCDAALASCRATPAGQPGGPR